MQSLEVTKAIKNEITDDDEELALCNNGTENAERMTVVKGIKNEEIEVGQAECELEESPSINTELKCELIEQESSNSFDLNYETKNEEMDISYPAVQFKEDVELKDPSVSDTVYATEGNWCDSDSKDNVKSEKQWQKTDQASNFKQQVKDILLSCFHCDYATKAKRNLVRHMLVHDETHKKMFLCPNCVYSTKYKPNLLRHVKHVHLGNYKMHSCRACEKCFKSKRALDAHIIKYHQGLIHLVSSKIHNCPMCVYYAASSGDLGRHMIKMHAGRRKMYLCKGCEKCFKGRSTLDDHIIKHHHDLIGLVSSKVHSCLECDYKTAGKFRLTQHMVNVHLGNYKRHSCRGCEKDFKQKMFLDNHIIKRHQNLIHLVSSKVHNCLTCDYRTTRKRDLGLHMKKVHLGNHDRHSCTYCEKQFDKIIALHDHIIKNHPNFNKTTINGNLRAHTIKTHFGKYKPYPCEGCAECFKDKRALKYHIKKHHQNLINSSVHNCPTCDYKTTSKSHLTRHRIKEHLEKGEAHSCRGCEKRFKEKMGLDDHIIKNHQNLVDLVSSKVHNCTICDYKTTKKGNLRQHRVKAHSGNCEKVNSSAVQ